MAYTKPDLKLDGAGALLLGKDCPVELNTFSEHLRRNEHFDVDDWRNPWQDYVDYLHSLFRQDISNRIAALQDDIAAIHRDEKRREDVKREEIKRIHQRIKGLRDGSEAMAGKFIDYKKDCTKRPDIKKFASDYFSVEWDALFNEKNEKIKVTISIRSGNVPFVNTGNSEGKVKLERLEAAAKRLPQKTADLFPVTLNMKIGDFDWPIVEFVDKP